VTLIGRLHFGNHHHHVHDGEGIFDPSWSCLNETCLWLLEELVEEEEVEVEDEVETKLVDLFFLPEPMMRFDQKL
jgi:hypothetical protein